TGVQTCALPISLRPGLRERIGGAGAVASVRAVRSAWRRPIAAIAEENPIAPSVRLAADWVPPPKQETARAGTAGVAAAAAQRGRRATAFASRLKRTWNLVSLLGGPPPSAGLIAARGGGRIAGRRVR